MWTVAHSEKTFLLSGNGDVLEPEQPVIGIGSGGNFAQSAALALLRHSNLSTHEIAEEAMKIAGDLCIYTNHHFTIETL